MEAITQGRIKQCRLSVGGVKEIYLFPYVKYNRSQIVLNGNKLVSFPATDIYKYEILNGSQMFSNIVEEDGGGKYYDQSINARLSTTKDSQEIIKLISKDYRIIVLDNNGLYRFLGAYVGIECVGIKQTTGTIKDDLNGFELDFRGKEENDALFIDDLSSAGFTIIL